MNSLSWLIYLAEVFGSFRVTFGILSGLLIFGCVGLVFMSGGEVFEDKNADARRWWFRGLAAAFALGAISMILPSSRTLYLIAASEIGEKAVASPEAKELFGEIRTTIMQQLKNLRDDK